MALEIKVPSVGESIAEVILAKWIKKDGDWVERDEIIAEFESEKATFELNAEKAGILNHIAQTEDTLKIGALVATIDTDAAKPEGLIAKEENLPIGEASITAANTSASKSTSTTIDQKATPVAAAIIADKKMDVAQVIPTGTNNKILKNDVLTALQKPGRSPEMPLFSRETNTQKMSNLRKTISRRLVEAKNTTAMLTTFNEVDMMPVMELRKKYKEAFLKKHGVGLGFMSFFTKACCFALQEWPAVNSYIDGDQILQHSYCDISIAVSAPKGLVVPVIRNAESLSLAEIERAVVELATKARENKLTIEEMTGGTFTITNGGVFGSLLSTPIINIPQSAILGMHKIEERPVAINGKVEIRPMMYLALSYDHRIIDGKESVSFLVRVKQLLENPSTMLIGKDPSEILLEL